jgi:hypothetical protein
MLRLNIYFTRIIYAKYNNISGSLEYGMYYFFQFLHCRLCKILDLIDSVAFISTILNLDISKWRLKQLTIALPYLKITNNFKFLYYILWFGWENLIRLQIPIWLLLIHFYCFFTHLGTSHWKFCHLLVSKKLFKQNWKK